MTEAKNQTVQVEVLGGKYTFIARLGNIQILEILRYGDTWITDVDGPGSNAVMALVLELDESIQRNKNLIKGIQTLYDEIKHGDEAHQSWLKDAIDKHFAELEKP